MLDPSLLSQLATHLERVTEPVELATWLDHTPASTELAGMLEQVAALSELVTVHPAATAPPAGRTPSFAIRRPGTAIDDLILTNDTWGENGDAAQVRQTATAVFAFGLTEGSADAAFVVTLPPGGYTVQVTGKGGTTGTALAEIYLVP